MNSGYIYCLTNPVMPGLVKIGKTTRTVEERVAELNTTGVPAPFVIEFVKKFNNVHTAEEQLHTMMNIYRYSSVREFFRVSVDTARKIVETYHTEMNHDEILETTPLTVTKTSQFHEALNDTYEINVDDKGNDNFTTARDLITYIRGKICMKTNGSVVSDTKIGRELAKMGLNSHVKKVNGAPTRVWLGIKRKILPADGIM